ncbi:hypothetical protein BDF19DRAFT_414667 [Syncephalis fuscata]|nr:hypothetical protein BDF19DRAFT_414667 [Syncephalis fuscata]
MRASHLALSFIVGLLALSDCVYSSNAPDVYGDIHLANEHMAAEMKLDEKINKEDDPYYFFNINDANGDGWLDGHELRAAFIAEDKEMKLKELDEWVARALKSEDVDGDNRISFNEYLASEGVN